MSQLTVAPEELVHMNGVDNTREIEYLKLYTDELDKSFLTSDVSFGDIKTGKSLTSKLGVTKLWIVASFEVHSLIREPIEKTRKVAKAKGFVEMNNFSWYYGRLRYLQSLESVPYILAINPPPTYGCLHEWETWGNPLYIK